MLYYEWQCPRLNRCRSGKKQIILSCVLSFHTLNHCSNFRFVERVFYFIFHISFVKPLQFSSYNCTLDTRISKSHHFRIKIAMEHWLSYSVVQFNNPLQTLYLSRPRNVNKTTQEFTICLPPSTLHGGHSGFYFLIKFYLESDFICCNPPLEIFMVGSQSLFPNWQSVYI